MDERTVKVRGFVYHKEGENPYQPGTVTVRQAIAVRGDKLDYNSLSPGDKQRADENDVFYTEEEAARLDEQGNLQAAPPELSTQDGEIILDENSSVEELAAWIAEDSPKIDEVLELADSPEMAQKLLDAENQATDNDPRKGLLEGLTRIISSDGT